jgi:hypothetical protein
VRAIALVVLALAGCSPPRPEPVPPPPSGPCRVEGLAGLVGHPATSELGREAQRTSGAARLRWIRPGDAVTMDFSPTRLNIHLDARNEVERFACG